MPPLQVTITCNIGAGDGFYAAPIWPFQFTMGQYGQYLKLNFRKKLSKNKSQKIHPQ
jgi:hypothetical protein